jgi:hypothetical protein
MKTMNIHIGDLPEHRTLTPEELESIQGGRTTSSLMDSPLPDKYRPAPESVWVREIVEDVEAY